MGVLGAIMFPVKLMFDQKPHPQLEISAVHSVRACMRGVYMMSQRRDPLSLILLELVCFLFFSNWALSHTLRFNDEDLQGECERRKGVLEHL